ncbi:MAG TPA: NF038130 family PEP-CTERM protein [Coleofasciculaceae cyanobacterium]
MLRKLQKFAIAAIAASTGAILTSPAIAGTLTKAGISGTASNDYLIYDANSTETFVVPNTSANLQKVLEGNSSKPTGNVELAASSEKTGFDFTKSTSLTGKLGGLDLTISSLTVDDWMSDVGGTTFGQKWFNETLSNNGFGNLSILQKDLLFSSFKEYGGFQRFSDPNISYINQDDQTGLIRIGLAGHLNATPLLTQSVDQLTAKLQQDLTKAKADLAKLPKNPPAGPVKTAKQQLESAITSLNSSLLLVEGMKTTLSAQTIQASEIFKYAYNGKTGYGYSFSATQSGLKAADDRTSHTGNYEVTFQGVPPETVPEPSAVLGLIGFGSVLVVRRQMQKRSVLTNQ